MAGKFQTLINATKEFFTIEEFVDETVFNRYGEQAWKFIDPTIVERS